MVLNSERGILWLSRVIYIYLHIYIKEVSIYISYKEIFPTLITNIYFTKEHLLNYSL